MKRHSMFHVSVLLMAALVFSTPLITLAQQNAEVPASKATTEVEKLQAIAAAKADAARDVNEWVWFTGGVLNGGLLAYSLWESGNSNPPVEAQVANCVGGLGLCSSIGYSLFVSATPAPGRLMGKSPEYVTSYVNTYVRNVKLRRSISSAAGCVGGACLTLVLLNVKVWGIREISF